MEKTQQQQDELDVIEKRILITFFGSSTIPENTAIVLKMMQINPNDYIRKFESTLLPIMKQNGMIDGALFKKLIQFSKYKDVVKCITIPDEDFYLSDIVITIIQSFIPGVSI